MKTIATDLRSGRQTPHCRSRRRHPQHWAIGLHRILLLTDLSSTTKAADCAVALARCFKAEILLAHVYQPLVCDPQFDFCGAQHLAMEKFEAEDRKFDKVADSISRRGITVTKVAAVGDVADCLRRIAALTDAELIVMLTRGHFAPPDFCESSATEQILENAHCPVLVVHATDENFAN